MDEQSAAPPTVWKLPLYEYPSHDSRQCGFIEIPREKCTFWAALKMGLTVHNRSGSYALVFSVADLAGGYPAFSMTLLNKDLIQRYYPDICEDGILGEWTIDETGKIEGETKPRITLVRECDPITFKRILSTEHLHPSWMWPAYRHIDQTK